MPNEIEVITVYDIKKLPNRYYPFPGTVAEAHAAILKDQEREPAKQKYPNVDTIYVYISQAVIWWRIVAIALAPREKLPTAVVEDD